MPGRNLVPIPVEAETAELLKANELTRNAFIDGECQVAGTAQVLRPTDVTSETKSMRIRLTYLCRELSI